MKTNINRLNNQTDRTEFIASIPSVKEQTLTERRVANMYLRKIAVWLGAITFVLAFIAFHAVINSNGVSTNAAKCASIGGIYSNQDEQCYYNGKATAVEQIIDKK